MHYPIQNRPTEQYDSTGVETSGIVYGGPCELIALEAKNNAAATRYLFLHDALAVPANGTAYSVVLPYPIPAGGTLTLDGGADLPRFATGLVWSSSSTDLTKTITLAADMIVTARVRVVQP